MSTFMALTAAMTLVPAILILKQLIFYKRKRYTALFFNFFLVTVSLNAVAVFITKEPVGFFRFAPESMANDITLLLAIVSMFILSFRNEWITSLPRKKKLLYSGLGIPLYIAIVSLFDFSYRTPLPAYSLSIAALSYTMWAFLVLYGGIALLKLFFHLPTARVFDKKMRELSSLYDFGRMLNSETTSERLLPLVAKLTTKVLMSDSVWLLLSEENGEKFSLAARENLTESDVQLSPFSGMQGLNGAIAGKKAPVLVNDVSHNRQFRDLLKWKKNARTIIGAPLLGNRGKLIGIIYATKTKEYTFDVDDLSLLEGIANQAAIALENVKLLQESIERERLEQELKVARDVQLKLLPQGVPNIPNFEIDAFCLTAYEVGGDYYDFFSFADGKPGIIIGDVSGKGTSAALYMAEFKGVVQTLAHSYTTPAQLAYAANRVVYSHTERKAFISAVVAKLDPANRFLTFARAGHPPIMYCSGDDRSPQNLMSAGIGIGLDSGDTFNRILEEKTVRLIPGASVVLYTDGVTEARNAKGEEFSEERLQALLQGCVGKSAEETKEQLIQSIIDFCGETPLHDDLTFIVLRCCTDTGK